MVTASVLALAAGPALSAADVVPATVVAVVLAASAGAMALTAFRRRDAD